MIMKRRLIGPTIITVALCGLVLDYLYLSQSPWSISRFLGRFLHVLAAIFNPSMEIANYRWLDQVIVPMSLIIVVLVLVWISVFRAKRAMAIATPDVALEPFARTLRAVAPSQARVEEPNSLRKSRQRTLMRRLVIAFSAVGIVFGGIVCLIVYSFLGPVIEKDVKSRTDAAALGLHEMAAPAMAAGRRKELTEVVEKYVSKDAAYIYIENGRGEMIAHWPADLPRYLHRDFPRSAERALGGVDADYRELPIYEIAKRLGNPNGGFAHLAIWRRAIDDQARHVLIGIAVMVLASLLAVTALFIWVMRSVNRPFVEIVDQAERISKGDFDVPLQLQRTDEIGELARSLERMRSSLRAVKIRLEQVGLAKQSSK
jgi:HAMP domain-containing protein